jgi:hypothetical protein
MLKHGARLAFDKDDCATCVEGFSSANMDRWAAYVAEEYVLWWLYFLPKSEISVPIRRHLIERFWTLLNTCEDATTAH